MNSIKNEMNGLQKAIEQLGEITVQRYLPKGMAMHNCDIHGGFLSHYKDSNPLCPLCITPETKANGTDASDVELYINLRDALAPATNPHE